MAETTLPLPGVRTPSGDAAKLESQPTPGTVKTPSVPNSLPAGSAQAAKATVAAAGGNSGGKPRRDGRVPGSLEAIEADREKERLRKQRWRDARAAAASAGNTLPAANTPEPGADTNSAPPANVVPFAPVPVDDWQAEDMREFAAEAVPMLEAWDIRSVRFEIKPLRLDAATESKIVSEAQWPLDAKASLIRGCPGTLAKIANWIRLPKTLKSELTSIPAALVIWRHREGVADRIEKLVREFKAKEADANPEKKS